MKFSNSLYISWNEERMEYFKSCVASNDKFVSLKNRHRKFIELVKVDAIESDECVPVKSRKVFLKKVGLIYLMYTKNIPNGK